MDAAKRTGEPVKIGDMTAPANETTQWGLRLAADVGRVLARHPHADPDVVRLTLISLQSPALERLNRSLRRGRGFAAFRKSRQANTN
jgi:hypothetical protein